MSIRIHNGTDWPEISDLQLYSGGQWQQAALKRFDGTQWEQLWPCHFSYTAEYSLADFVVMRGRNADQVQVTPEHLIVGCSTTMTSRTLHDSLLFFPMDDMRRDLAGAQILSASLRVSRLPQSGDDGITTADVTVGSTLSGVDPSRTDNSWSRQYTLLRDSHFSIRFGATKTASINVSGVQDLVSGAADCLCLPTTTQYIYKNAGYSHLDPQSVRLIVTYYI